MRPLGSRGRKELGTAVSVVLILVLGGCAGAGTTVTGAASTGDTTQNVESATSTIDVGSEAAALTAAPSADVQPPMETEEPDATMATGAPEVTQDFEEDAGADLEEFDYPADPDPAESVVATLCSLNRDYFSSLGGSSPRADDSLRMAALGVSDMVGYWESLVPTYPEIEDDVATATSIQEKWDEALLAQDNGDEGGSRTALEEADALIAELPPAAEVDCVP